MWGEVSTPNRPLAVGVVKNREYALRFGVTGVAGPKIDEVASAMWDQDLRELNEVVIENWPI